MRNEQHLFLKFLLTFCDCRKYLPIGSASPGGSADKPTRQLQIIKSLPRHQAKNTLPVEEIKWNSRKDLAFLNAVPYTQPVSIVIPVYNGLEDLKRCVDSIVRCTKDPYEVVIVDDCSTEKEMHTFLNSLSRDNHFIVLRNETNVGFVVTANRGMQASDHDVVLLNSDTMVTPRWLHKLRIAAYSERRVATATPFSNAAGAFSVPKIGVNSPIPIHLELHEISRMVERLSQHLYPSVPTGNGFCMYLKRSALDHAGYFDEETFGRGYGEENDLCMRFLSHGWKNIIDDATFVYHRGSASFGNEKKTIEKVHRKAVDLKHPDYTRLVHAFVNSKEINRIRERIGKEMYGVSRWSNPSRRRLLYVLHQGGGGVPNTNLDLLKYMESVAECFVLTCDTVSMFLSLFRDGILTSVKSWKLKKPWEPTAFYRQEFLNIYRETLFCLKIELVHVRHVLKHTFDLFDACRELGIPVVVSFHDFYLLNPFVHLVDRDGRYDPRSVPPENKQWNVPSPLLKPCPNNMEFVRKWRKNVQRCLKMCHAFVTASENTRQTVLSHYPYLKSALFPVIEHGRDFPPSALVGRFPAAGEKVRILCLGNMDLHKGSKLIGEVVRINAAAKGRLEFHFLGTVDAYLEKAGLYHGKYDRETALNRIEAIAPHYCANLSICAETFSHTLTEAWAAGIPVIGSSFGAVADRIAQHGGGWVIDVGDPVQVYQRINEIIQDEDGYQREMENIKEMHLKTASEMAVGYQWFYESVMSRYQGKESPYRIAVFCRDSFPGTVFIRTIFPLTHPRTAGRILSVYLNNRIPEKALQYFLRENHVDAVLVQRDSLDQNAASNLAGLCKENGVKIVLDVDDDLIHLDSRHPDFHEIQNRLKGMLTIYKHCDAVITSTNRLARSFAKDKGSVHVFANAINERIWLCPLGSQKVSKGFFRFCFRKYGRKKSGSIRALYMGTKTHDDDFAVVNDAILEAGRILRKDYGIHFGVDIVGVLQRQRLDNSFCNVIRIPHNRKIYPHFVQWLRAMNRWDFGIAPLAPTQFNESKSAIKFFDYAALGLSGIFSAVGEYVEVVKNEENGLLCCSNSKQEWISLLLKMATQFGLRRKLTDEAKNFFETTSILKTRSETYCEIWARILKQEPPKSHPGASLS